MHERAIRINVRRYSNFVNTVYFCLQKQQDLQHSNHRCYYENYNYDNFEHYPTALLNKKPLVTLNVPITNYIHKSTKTL